MSLSDSTCDANVYESDLPLPLCAYSFSPTHDIFFNDREYGFRRGDVKYDDYGYVAVDAISFGRTIFTIEMRTCRTRIKHFLCVFIDGMHTTLRIFPTGPGIDNRMQFLAMILGVLRKVHPDLAELMQDDVTVTWDLVAPEQVAKNTIAYTPVHVRETQESPL